MRKQLLLSFYVMLLLSCTSNSKLKSLEDENAELKLQKENIELKQELENIERQKAKERNKEDDTEYQNWKEVKVNKYRANVREAELEMEQYQKLRAERPLNRDEYMKLAMDSIMLPQWRNDLQQVVDDKFRDLWYERRTKGYYGDPLP